jgi:ParB family transcriptional regulator, chromosome partitioning protein
MHAEKKGRLGRGLEALVGGSEGSVAVMSRNEVPVEAIEKNPYQPRKTFDDDELESLGESIRNHGVLQPLVVRQVGERYQLIAGERRLRAARAAGLLSVPVTVVDFNDQQVLEAALVENIQRADLNPIEKAQGFKEYLARYTMTHEQLAGRLGLGRPTITNLVALLDLPSEVQDAVRRGELSVGHAKALKGLADAARQQAIAREVIARGMSVHATEAYVKQLAAEEKEASTGSAQRRTAPEKTAHVSGIEDELRQKFGMKVEIRVKGKDRGQVVLSFESNDDFERLLEVFRR